MNDFAKVKCLCLHCNASYQLSKKAIGKTATCKACKKKFKVEEFVEDNEDDLFLQDESKDDYALEDESRDEDSGNAHPDLFLPPEPKAQKEELSLPEDDEQYEDEDVKEVETKQATKRKTLKRHSTEKTGDLKPKRRSKQTRPTNRNTNKSFHRESKSHTPCPNCGDEQFDEDQTCEECGFSYADEIPKWKQIPIKYLIIGGSSLTLILLATILTFAFSSSKQTNKTKESIANKSTNNKVTSKPIKPKKPTPKIPKNNQKPNKPTKTTSSKESTPEKVTIVKNKPEVESEQKITEKIEVEDDKQSIPILKDAIPPRQFYPNRFAEIYTPQPSGVGLIIKPGLLLSNSCTDEDGGLILIHDENGVHRIQINFLQKFKFLDDIHVGLYYFKDPIKGRPEINFYDHNKTFKEEIYAHAWGLYTDSKLFHYPLIPNFPGKAGYMHGLTKAGKKFRLSHNFLILDPNQTLYGFEAKEHATSFEKKYNKYSTLAPTVPFPEKFQKFIQEFSYNYDTKTFKLPKGSSTNIPIVRELKRPAISHTSKGNHVAFLYEDKTSFEIMNRKNFEVIKENQSEEPINHIRFVGDYLVAFPNSIKQCYIYSVPEGELLAQVSTTFQYKNPTFDVKGRYFLAKSSNNDRSRLYLHNISKDKPPAWEVFRGNGGIVKNNKLESTLLTKDKVTPYGFYTFGRNSLSISNQNLFHDRTLLFRLKKEIYEGYTIDYDQQRVCQLSKDGNEYSEVPYQLPEVKYNIRFSNECMGYTYDIIHPGETFHVKLKDNLNPEDIEWNDQKHKDDWTITDNGLSFTYNEGISSITFDIKVKIGDKWKYRSGRVYQAMPVTLDLGEEFGHHQFFRNSKGEFVASNGTGVLNIYPENEIPMGKRGANRFFQIGKHLIQDSSTFRVFDLDTLKIKSEIKFQTLDKIWFMRVDNQAVGFSKNSYALLNPKSKLKSKLKFYPFSLSSKKQQYQISHLNVTEGTFHMDGKVYFRGGDGHIYNIHVSKKSKRAKLIYKTVPRDAVLGINGQIHFSKDKALHFLTPKKNKVDKPAFSYPFKHPSYSKPFKICSYNDQAYIIADNQGPVTVIVYIDAKTFAIKELGKIAFQPRTIHVFDDNVYIANQKCLMKLNINLKKENDQSSI